MQFSFVFLDLTTSATPDTLKPAPLFGPLINALIEQLEGPFGAEWGEHCCDFRVGSSPTDRLPGEVAVNFRDTIAAQGALADHQVNNGVPDIEIAGDSSSRARRQVRYSISVGVDHEVLEPLIDAGANGWKDRQDVSGLIRCGRGLRLRAEHELRCIQWPFDEQLRPTELSSSRERLSPWDHLGVMTSWRDVSSGYGIVAESPTDVSQIGSMARRSLVSEWIIAA